MKKQNLTPDNIIQMMGLSEEPEYESLMYEYDSKYVELASAIIKLYGRLNRYHVNRYIIRRIVILTDKLRLMEEKNRKLYERFIRAQELI